MLAAVLKSALAEILQWAFGLDMTINVYDYHLTRRIMWHMTTPRHYADFSLYASKWKFLLVEELMAMKSTEANQTQQWVI
uniref:Uncharacterized protein n=1 Tax=Romanomermis culicivorax TaxID=13658 RepID=A0A915J611_ROMCU